MASDFATYVPEGQNSLETKLWQFVPQTCIESFPQDNCLANVDFSSPVLMPVTVRLSVLNLRFLKLNGCVLNAQLQELQHFYVVKSAELETDRLSSLNASNNNMMRFSINSYYDQQHHALLARVEHSLKLLEANSSSVAKKTPQTKRKSSTTNKAPTKCSSINSVAVRIMSNWYDRNSEHPYPSYETAEVIANAGNISVEQVKKWFANRRLRFNNTKHITDIAKRRKRCRTISQDDIFLTGAGSSD